MRVHLVLSLSASGFQVPSLASAYPTPSLIHKLWSFLSCSQPLLCSWTLTASSVKIILLSLNSMTLNSLDYPPTQPPSGPSSFSSSPKLYSIKSWSCPSLLFSLLLYALVVTFGLFLELIFPFQESNSPFHFSTSLLWQSHPSVRMTFIHALASFQLPSRLSH